MRRMLFAVCYALAAASLAAFSTTSFAMPTIFPTGVTIHDKNAAYPCDVMFSAADGKSYLIDMDGNIIKRWDHGGGPAAILDPSLVGGRKGVAGLNLVDVSSSELPQLAGIGLVPGQYMSWVNKTFGLIDWNGKVLWQWSGPPSVGAALQNHDWDRLPNGDMLILSDRVKRDSRFGDRKIIDDVIYEVDPSGKVVWSWSATAHLDEFGFTPAQIKLVEASTSLDYLHMNAMSPLGPNHWEKAGDKRFAADNIMISSRNANFVAIIDRRTGRIVWRIGPNYPKPAKNKSRTIPRPVDQTSGQHDAHMIPEGLPGAGNILLFDNQGDAGYPSVQRALLGGSRVLEINPADKTIVWEYNATKSGRPKWTFFSPFIGSAQRLPNGNTLIDEGSNGRFFQVTPAGKIVWEYISPFYGGFLGTSSIKGNWAYRAQAVPLSWVPADKNVGHAGISR